MTESAVTTPESMDELRAAWAARRADAATALEERRQKARAVADEMAALLKSQYGATKVVLFGSVVEGKFHAHSDIDIAAWGIAPVDRMAAYGDIVYFSREFEGDLVWMEQCKPHVAGEVARTGVEL